MCGRYVSPDVAEIERAFGITRAPGLSFARHFNVAPTAQVPVMRRGRELRLARWGFIPYWWSKPKPPGNTFNARAEDAASKPMWRDAYREYRCLMPAAGWYEWQNIGGAKQPHYVYRRDRALFCFGGVMSKWRARDQESIYTCAILTRPASTALEEIHERMPLVLPPEALDGWLAGSLDADEVGPVELAHHPVATRVNAAKEDDEKLTAPLAG
jgi:putative SOS response-associated peptidase YedK